MIVYIIAALQVAAVQPNPQATANDQLPVIWRDLRAGMTPEQFADKESADRAAKAKATKDGL